MRRSHLPPSGKAGRGTGALILVLGGLGLPVPEEAPIVLAAVLSKGGKMWWPPALGACLVGVLLGDFVVYFLGYFYGEKVMSLPLTRKFLSRAREAQIQGYFHRHGFKILVLGRFAVGFRTAAYLTAGILKLPALKLFLTDLIAGRLHYMFDGISTSLGYIQAGSVRMLGVAGQNRSSVLPDAPTIAESGLPGFDTMVWFGLFAPAGTPRSPLPLSADPASA